MALEKILNARFGQKIDTYENWTKSDATTQANKTNADFVLKRGEIGFCEIPSGNTEATTAPTILFKVGDGTTAFKGLKWGSALAADVHSWAKMSEEDFVTWVNTQINFPTVTVPVKGVTDQAVDKQFVSDIYLDGDQVKANHRTIVEDDIKSALGTFGLTSSDYQEGFKEITVASLNVRDAVTADEFIGSLTGNADTATKATQDAKGNVIDTTYATKEELNNKADANATYELSYDTTNKKIILTGTGTGSKTTEIDATAFIKDGMIQSVELVAEDAEGNKGQFLKITWNTDADVDADDVTYVNVTTLVDVYTGTNGTNIKVTVTSDNKIEADLTDSVKASLAKADSAVQDVYVSEGTENGTVAITVDGSTGPNIKVKGLNDAAYKTAKYFEDDATSKANSAKEAAIAAARQYSDSLNHEDTTYTAPEAGGLKINENNEISINEEVVFIFNAGSSTTVI